MDQAWLNALGCALLALIGGILGQRQLQAGRHRRPEDVAPTHPMGWIAPAATLLGALAGWNLARWPWPVPVTVTVAGSVLIVLAAIDLDVHRLPRAITWPAYPALALLLMLCSWTTSDPAALRRAAYAGVAAWAVYYLLHRIARRRGLGRGDVTLAGLLGMLLGWFGWPVVLVATYLTFILAGLWAGGLVLLRRADRSTRLAFGPFMAIGALVLLLAQ